MLSHTSVDGFSLAARLAVHRLLTPLHGYDLVGANTGKYQVM
jgi:hypothetical protein